MTTFLFLIGLGILLSSAPARNLILSIGAGIALLIPMWFWALYVVTHLSFYVRNLLGN